MAAFRNDGTVQYGSMVLSIGAVTAGSPPTIGTTVSYVADNVEISRPGKTIERTNEIDEPSGQLSYAGFVTGSATIQLATSSTLVPGLGRGFTLTVFDTDNSGATDAEFFYIDSISTPYAKDGERKVNITFRKIYGTT
jgi:hypothetical protein